MSSFLSLDAQTLVFAAAGLVLVLTVKAYVARRRRNPRGLPLPPGPKPYPIIGNVTQIPQDNPWEAYHEMCKEHGDMIYVNAMGTGILILDNASRAFEVLEQRGLNYSDRPWIPTVELTRMDWSFGVMNYGTKWKQLRREFHQFFRRDSLAQFHPMIFLQRLKSKPENFIEDLELLFGSIIMRTAYGFDDIGQNKAIIANAEALIEAFGESNKPGKFMVNIFPVLRFLPAWFPGGGFQRYFQKVAGISNETVQKPFEQAKADLRSVHPSMVTILLDRIASEKNSVPGLVDPETMAKGICALTYLGMSERTMATATACILALANNPEIQRRAHAEIDAIVGAHRLPTVGDRHSLPYVHAIVKETYRWFTIIPLGIPHASAEDDEYDGYFIPKGTIIMPNAWAILHDPAVFDKPFEFIPERYLKDGKIDPKVLDADSAGFGYGRRICPGIHFSHDTLFLFIASLLASFDITPPNDASGNPTVLKLEVNNSTITKPLPFKCNFAIRPGREALLH
ncbi:cytochrome P450 98A3 [Ephemerocybe angulata]|uniref:Cytochrome P450 98A3 n=1 Tax=Ephemerocybe angulata TaxID=980116 RepID=A0A8H6HW22_9AGAR|nr:cytochrome P450 98A3 [Tulosesus angulatus]